MNMNALEDLLLQELSELYAAEQIIVGALPKMAKSAHDDKLRSAFELHLKQTRNHIERLNKIFKTFGREPGKANCEPISEIVKQGELLAEKQADPSLTDASLIAAGQKVEHYEIALYGTAKSHAQLLGYTRAADLLNETLKEEEATDALLSQLATKRVNPRAARAPFSYARTAARAGEEAGGLSIGTLISGLAIGAAVALLYAPKSGESLRRGLKEQARGLTDKLGDTQRELMDQAMH